jgi:phosphatidylglycerol:prolipoprotein diacylglycerol transferase
MMVRGAPGGFFEHLFSRGGMTFYGGLLGGTVLALGSALYRKLRLLDVVNGAAASLAVGQAIGRVGCLLVGDDYGRPTDGPWGIAFPEGLPPTTVPVHPTQIYEAAWLFLLTAWLWRRRARASFLFGEYLLLAGVGRFAIEFVRINPVLVGPFTNAQVTSLIEAAIGLIGIAYLWQRRPNVSQPA